MWKTKRPVPYVLLVFWAYASLRTSLILSRSLSPRFVGIPCESKLFREFRGFQMRIRSPAEQFPGRKGEDCVVLVTGMGGMGSDGSIATVEHWWLISLRDLSVLI